MDIEQARFNMIEQQIRTWDVLNQEVLDLLFKIKREEYVPPAYRLLAFSDLEIPLGQGESMLAPKLEARLLQELQLKKTDKVLEIGAGSGYMTALLASSASLVHSVERIPEFKMQAEKKLAEHGITNAVTEIGDGARGWPRQGPYDAIILTGSVPILDDAFLKSLSVGGRLIAIVGEAPAMRARLFTRYSESGMRHEDLFETAIPALYNAPQIEKFVF